MARQIAALAGPAVAVIETGMPVARQLRSRLESEGLLSGQSSAASPGDRVNFFTTGDPEAFKTKLLSLLGAQWKGVKVQHLAV